MQVLIEVTKANKPASAELHGNNAAFTCPECAEVFIVSQILDRKGRNCPKCGMTTASISKGFAQLTTASK